MVIFTRPCTRSSTRRALRASFRASAATSSQILRRHKNKCILLQRTCPRPKHYEDLRWYRYWLSSTKTHMCLETRFWNVLMENLMLFLEQYINQEEKRFQVTRMEKRIIITNLQSKKKAHLRLMKSSFLLTDRWILLLQRKLTQVGIHSNFRVLDREDPFIYICICLDVNKWFSFFFFDEREIRSINYIYSSVI